MKTIQVQDYGGVVMVVLDRGVTNAINLDLLSDLGDVLRQLKDDPGVSALVLGSQSDKFFSIGFDIPELYDLEREAFSSFYRRFNDVCLDLFSFPKPTVAALRGHAIAGGCILALCCDYRIIAGGRKLMGLNELKLGVPVPYLADCILHQVVGARNARAIIDTGEFFEPDELLQLGLVDGVFPLGEVHFVATEKARSTGAHPHKAFAVSKHNRTTEVENRLRSNIEGKSRAFIDCWYSEDGRALLKTAMEKF